jgi:hypothetical protein
MKDPIKRCRDLVSTCRASGQRRADLRATIIDGNKRKDWAEDVPDLQLLRDVDTRWSSVYLMVKRVLQLYPVSHTHVS